MAAGWASESCLGGGAKEGIDVAMVASRASKSCLGGGRAKEGIGDQEMKCSLRRRRAPQRSGPGVEPPRDAVGRRTRSRKKVVTARTH